MEVCEKIQEVIEQFCCNSHMLGYKNAILGFDGFVDSIVRVVKQRENGQEAIYFQDIKEFGGYLSEKGGFSGSIELVDVVSKIGGNMPIMSYALGGLGVRAHCVGAFGSPEIKPEFLAMEEANCTLYSLCEPGVSLALEFCDGKIMMAKMGALGRLQWEDIKRTIDLDKLIELYNLSDMVGIVNWSEIENSTSIWKGFLNEVVLNGKADKEKIAFFDLSDCSKRVKGDIEQALLLIREFSSHTKVILGMNENEALLVCNCIAGNRYIDSVESMGDFIYEKLGIDIMVIHPTSCSLAWDRNGRYHTDNLYVTSPKVTTGGGDNFNAGFCAAQLLGLGIEESMILANATSGYYVKNGVSPNRGQLLEFLNEWKNEFNKCELKGDTP